MNGENGLLGILSKPKQIKYGYGLNGWKERNFIVHFQASFHLVG